MIGDVKQCHCYVLFLITSIYFIALLRIILSILYYICTHVYTHVYLTMEFTVKLVCMAHHFILLRLNPFDPCADREGWWFECSCVIAAGLLVSRGC